MLFSEFLNQYGYPFLHGLIGALLYEGLIYANIIPYSDDIIENNKVQKRRFIICPLVGGVFISAIANSGGVAWHLIGGATSISLLERITGIDSKNNHKKSIREAEIRDIEREDMNNRE